MAISTLPVKDNAICISELLSNMCAALTNYNNALYTTLPLNIVGEPQLVHNEAVRVWSCDIYIGF